MFHAGWVLAAGLVLSGCATTGAVDRGSATSGAREKLVGKRPNVVFFLVDDLGWKDVGFMGSTFYETPHIDKLAAEGMVFTSAYTCGPNCAPTRASLISGTYTPRHRMHSPSGSAKAPANLMQLLVDPIPTALEPEVVTIAEAIQGAGYTSASVGKWHLGDDPERGPTGQGFALNVGGSRSGHPASYWWPYEQGTSWHNVIGLKSGGWRGEYLTDRLTDEALRFIEAQKDGPFFLYFPHYAVHTPLQGKEALAEKYRAKGGSGGQDNAVYAAMIESVDASLGRVMARLAALGISEETLVIFFVGQRRLGAGDVDGAVAWVERVTV
jgi:arylsulfatase A-like enzyme